MVVWISHPHTHTAFTQAPRSHMPSHHATIDVISANKSFPLHEKFGDVGKHTSEKRGELAADVGCFVVVVIGMVVVGVVVVGVVVVGVVVVGGVVVGVGVEKNITSIGGGLGIGVGAASHSRRRLAIKSSTIF